MHFTTKTLLAMTCCLLMSACSTFDGASEEGEDREMVYYDSDVYVPMTYPEMAREMSNGSVQIFGLDEPASPIVTADAQSILQRSGGVGVPPVNGVPSSSDPNVTVFPFEDSPSYGGGESPQARPPLSPPSGDFRPLQAPFGGPLQSPAPLDSPVRSYDPMAPQGSTSKIYYRHGSSSLDKTGQQVVDFVSQKGGRISVEGHASERAEVNDPVERDIVNLKMSMDRAFKVSSDLIRRGVPAEAIETKAYGATRPSGSMPGISAEAASRRVEISASGPSMQQASIGRPILRPPQQEVTSYGTPMPLDAPIPPLARY